MNSKSGEVVTGLLIGLAVGAVVAFVAASNEAKHQANLSGTDVGVLSVMAAEPGKYAIQGLTPAAAGAGIGWLVESINDKSSGDKVSINVPDNRGSVNVTVTGNQDNDSTSTPTYEGSYNTTQELP